MAPYDQKFGAPVPKVNTFEGLIQRNKPNHKKDVYDGDVDTVSTYDGMELHEHLGRYDTDGFKEMTFVQKPHRRHHHYY